MMIAYLQKEGVLPYLQNLSASLAERQRRTMTFNKSLYRTSGNYRRISETQHTADITYEQSYTIIFSAFTPSNTNATLRTLLQGFFSHYQ